MDHVVTDGPAAMDVYATNASLTERATKIIQSPGLQAASAADAREILGLQANLPLYPPPERGRVGRGSALANATGVNCK